MAEIHDTLRRLLENPELQLALAEAFYAGLDSPSAFDEIDSADHKRHARGIFRDKHEDLCETEISQEEYSADSPFEEVPNKLKEVIQAFIIDKLPLPAAITVEELTSIAIAHLAGVPLQDSEHAVDIARAYQRFVDFAVLEIEAYRGTAWNSFNFGHWTHCSEDEWDAICDSSFSDATVLRLWSSASGFRLCIANPYRQLPDGWIEGRPAEEQMPVDVCGNLTGFCTPLALERAKEQLTGVIECIVKSLDLSLTTSDGKATLWGLSPITCLIRGDGPRMISSCLSAFLRQPQDGKNAQVLDRLHNAIVLLMYADQAGADPVALALSFAAIEALVCEHHELPEAKQIKRHVATLLVQDADIRKSRERVIDKLYDIRSQVMHGNRISASEEKSLCVRRIAAGVLRGIVSWMAHQERMAGETADTSWKEFMDEVNAASRKPDIVVGVPDLSELIPDKVPT